MKVFVKKGVAVKFGERITAFGRGECELPAFQAEYLIGKGWAELIEEKKKVKPKVVTVQEVKAETRPVRKKVK